MDNIKEGDIKVKVLITGASSGIGKELAKMYAKRNYELILVARNKEKLQEAKKEIIEISNNDKIELEFLDISIEENAIKLYNKYPQIDILINNAGFGTCGQFVDTNLEKELKMINTNIVAYHILTKLYLQTMVKKDSGKILNVASIAGFLPGPLMASYYATKNYIVAMCESIREELKKRKSKVVISILCPGPVNTNFNKVADVKFSMREANSQDIASYAIKKLDKNKFYIVPGIDVKFVRVFAKVFPNYIISKVIYRVQKRKIM